MQEYVTDIGPHDCLLGRGAGPNEHSGNISFRLVVSKHKKEYMATTNRQFKNLIAQRTIDIIKSNGGRFLQKVKDRDDEVYVLADDSVVLEKTKQALRHIERSKRAARRQERVHDAVAAPRQGAMESSSSDVHGVRTVTPSRSSSPSCSTRSGSSTSSNAPTKLTDTLLGQSLFSSSGTTNSTMAPNVILAPKATTPSFSRAVLESAPAPTSEGVLSLLQQQQTVQSLCSLLASSQQSQHQPAASVSAALAGLLGANNANSSAQQQQNTAVMIGILALLSSVTASRAEGSSSSVLAQTSSDPVSDATKQAVAQHPHLARPPTKEEQKVLSLVLGISEEDTLALSPEERLLAHRKATSLVAQQQREGATSDTQRASTVIPPSFPTSNNSKKPSNSDACSDMLKEAEAETVAAAARLSQCARRREALVLLQSLKNGLNIG